jgi:hypothetical protein
VHANLPYPACAGQKLELTETRWRGDVNDSNTWGGASGHTYAFTRKPNGTTDIDVVVVREGKNFKGWLLGFVLGTIGKRVLEKAFENSVKAIEARNSASRPRLVAA